MSHKDGLIGLNRQFLGPNLKFAKIKGMPDGVHMENPFIIRAAIGMGEATLYHSPRRHRGS